jgi:hypothetical protein
MNMKERRYYSVHYLVESDDEDSVQRMGSYIWYMAGELARDETNDGIKVSVAKRDTERA